MPKAKPKAYRKLTPATVSEYIAAAPKEARGRLRQMRAILRKAAPRASEAIKWRVPVFVERRILFSFAAYTSHVNFMPTPSVMKRFAAELRKYRTGKATIQFPHDQPLPKGLIGRMAALRVRELREKDIRWM